jgi:hypothetical protein
MLVEHRYDFRIAAIHQLRINVKSLAAEARLIRHEERRAGPAFRNMLADHRRGRVRDEARYAQLALAFVRGRPYSTVERTEKGIDFKRLVEKVKRFMPGNNESQIREWMQT